MNKTTEIVAIEETPQSPKQPTPNPLLSFFSNLNFHFELPFFPPKPKSQLEEPPKQAQVSPSSKPNVVRFPKTQVVVPPSLEAEPDADQSSTKTSNPIILWQVYVLGGIIISRWIWARWNERKGGGRPPNDESAEGRRPSDDGRRSSDNE
ncbi:uncharacterized protein LOC113873473 [Abrus precatorius]|uniref:Uncharacterized protein LOC113873473 n=1 Tax=Abrus precatorius TaxID=3816 RepID=A0A8B8MFR1_ABRPR|nr:uncharacterized protein LOC113873473 [Abrus precatorius]